MSPIFAIFWTIALLIGDAPWLAPPAAPDAVVIVVDATTPPAAPAAWLSQVAPHDSPVHESASLTEQTFEEEDSEDSPLDGWLSLDRPALGRFTVAQLLSASREMLDGSLIDLRSTCLRC